MKIALYGYRLLQVLFCLILAINLSIPWFIGAFLVATAMIAMHRLVVVGEMMGSITDLKDATIAVLDAQKARIAELEAKE